MFEYLTIQNKTFEVPTDWQIILLFNYTGYFSPSEITILSWVEEYQKDDQANIAPIWKPTGTSFVASVELKKLKEETELKI